MRKYLKTEADTLDTYPIKTEASTLDTYSIDQSAYTTFRQRIDDLQHRCVALLDVLKAEEANELQTSKKLEGAIVDASEWVVLRLSFI